MIEIVKNMFLISYFCATGVIVGLRLVTNYPSGCLLFGKVRNLEMRRIFHAIFLVDCLFQIQISKFSYHQRSRMLGSRGLRVYEVNVYFSGGFLTSHFVIL